MPTKDVALCDEARVEIPAVASSPEDVLAGASLDDGNRLAGSCPAGTAALLPVRCTVATLDGPASDKAVVPDGCEVVARASPLVRCASVAILLRWAAWAGPAVLA